MLTMSKLRRSETNPDTDKDEGGARSAWTWIAALVLVVIAVAAIVLALLGPAPDDQASPRPAPARSSPASPAPDASASTCGLPAGDQAVPSVAPVSTDWELVGSIAAPTAPQSIGPGVVNDGLRSCFARSPLGALYAAVSFVASTSEPRLREPAVRELTATGPGRDRAIDLVEGADPGPAGSGVQVAGFTFLNWNPDSATVDLATNVESTPVHLPVPLRWQDGDWKIDLPADGDIYANIAPLPNLTGYAPWSGA